MMASRQRRGVGGQAGPGDRQRGLQQVPGQVGQRLGDLDQAQLAGQVAAGDLHQLAAVGIRAAPGPRPARSGWPAPAVR